MRERWLNERRQEHYYRLAKRTGFRSRASFKLMQIDERFDIFREGDAVADLGAAPGGWLQVARELVGEKGRVVGVDLRPIKRLDDVVTIMGDITEDSTMLALVKELGGKADVILSDMAPDISGNYSTDHARSVHLCKYALGVCDRVLKKNGKLVMKVFMGDMIPLLRDETERRFMEVKMHSPDASRPTSSEMYMIATGFKAQTRVKMVERQEEKPKEFTIKGDLL
ncbi:MAG: RlmE family RNA methyltransferase [Candidatus Thermoplasmatota archaeon]|jgi:23S rRNA (uridine2552-2'-O)-methyltransferase|nr:RlmE family RNA methyltransferase [Candidatus Thermoplasmatota archaeon]